MTPSFSPLSSAVLLALAAPAIAQADDAGTSDKNVTELDGLEVQGDRVERASSPKYTAPLLDTPQTITVVTREVMDQQGLIGLRDILSTLPGITFGAGEGGGGYGDSVNLRGFSASSDITVDGVRDSAQYTRTDNFNLESIELVNGANSAYSGAGSVGGTINLVNKVAREGDLTTITLGAGTDSFGRATVDSNFDLGQGQALRVNAMAHRNDVPDRDVEEYRRWGIAPSFAIGLGTDTRFSVSYLHQQDDNIPEYGVPYFAAYGGLLPGVSRESYFGYRNMDTQEVEVDVLTGIFDHDFNETTSIRNLARVQRVDQYTVVNPTQGTWCLDSGVNPANGTACAFPGTYQPSGPRGTTRDTRNGLAYNQTDLTSRFATGGISHTMVAGVSFLHETYDLDNGNSQRNADGTTPVYPLMDLHDPDNIYAGPVNYVRSGRTAGTLDNQAVYLFDTLEFNPQWQLGLGARYERNEGDTRTRAFDAAGNVTRDATFDNADNLFSYRAGLVYKPAENGSVYLAYSDSRTPSKASVNGSCTVQTCSVDPETAVNIELGTKWNVLGEKLALTAAAFRNERQNYKVADPGNPDNPSGMQQLDGQARVDGVILGAAGRITDAWSVFANYAFLDSEVLQSVSDFVKESTGIDAQAGNPLANVPEHSGSVWTTYALADWTFGYGVNYQGSFYLASTDNAPQAKSYTMHRAMLGYRFNEDVGLQLNVDNLFDKQYFTRIRNNGWATPGAARSVVLTATVRF
jgi:catecholate siderophore receptor